MEAPKSDLVMVSFDEKRAPICQGKCTQAEEIADFELRSTYEKLWQTINAFFSLCVCVSNGCHVFQTLTLVEIKHYSELRASITIFFFV